MRLSFRNILGIFLLVLLVGYAGIKGLIYYKVKSGVDTASNKMRIFATLRYEGISSSLLDRSVTLENVSFLLNGLEDGFNIDTITLQTDDIGYLLKGFDFRRGDLPERFNISIKGSKVDLYGSMIDKVDQSLNELNSMSKGLVTSACGNKLFLRPADFRQMGYDILNSDIEFGYKFTGQGIQLTYDVTTRDFGSASMLIKMTGPTRPSAMAFKSNPPQLTEISITYQDLSYVHRSNEYCAKEGNRDITKYIEAEVNKPDKAYAYQWGFIPGPGLKQAYKEFLTNPGTISLTMHPPADFTPGSLGLYKPETIPTLLNMKLSVNEKPVSDLSFSFIADDNEEIASLQDRFSTFKDILQKDDKKTPLVQQPTKIKKTLPARYHEVKVAALKSHIDDKVRVYTKKSKQIRSGRLDKVTASALHVTQDVHQGKFTMIIPKTDVLKVEVLFAR
ncbi:MAG: hypothetical protein P8Y24_10120 [Gammaproteobacteria bacterium]